MQARITGTFIWVAIMAVLVIVMLIDATSLPTNLRETPILLGSALLVLFALIMIGEAYPPAVAWLNTALTDLWKGAGGDALGAGKNADNAATPTTADAVPWPAVLRVLAYIVGFWTLVFVFGLYVVPPLLIAVFLVAEAGVKLRHAALSAIIACAVLYAGLHFLRIDLWPGVVTEIVPGIIGGAIVPDL